MPDKLKAVINKYLEQFSIVPIGGRACWYFTNWCLLHNYTKNYKKWPVITGGLSHSKNNLSKWYYLWPKNVVLSKYLELCIENQEIFKEIKNTLDTTSKSVQNKFSSIDFEKISADKLCKLVPYFAKSFMSMSHVSVILRFIDLSILEYFNEKFHNHKKKDELIRYLSVSAKKSYSIKEELAIAKVAKELKVGVFLKKPKKLAIEIAKIKKMYCWTTCGYYNEPARTENDYLNIIKNISLGNPGAKIKELAKRHQEDLVKRKKLIKLLSVKEKKIAKVAAETNRLKDYYKYSTNKVLFMGEELFTAIANKINEPIDFIKNLTPEEIVSLIEGKKIDKDLINNRNRNSVIITNIGRYNEYFGSVAEHIEDKYLKIEKETNRELRGRIACRGKATGKICIIRGSNEFNKLKGGEILVVFNTSPDYVKILHNVSAIIAEEGGITAHVSIISRELGIPCIVGIKRATELLKDGDLVEVDANSGVIKVIKNK